MKQQRHIGAAVLCLSVFGQVAAFAGVKYWDNPDFKAFDVGDYVQDGLVVNYDGIRNAGPTAPHDSAAMTWVNCANPGTYDMVRYSTNGTKDNSNQATATAWNQDASKGSWTDYGFVFSKDSIFWESTDFKLPKAFTHQLLVEATSADQSGIGYPVCGYNASLWNNGGSIGIRSSGTIANTMYFTPLDNAGANSGNRPAISGSSFTYGTAILRDKEAVMFAGTMAPWQAASTGGTSGHYVNSSYNPVERTIGNGISLGGHYPRTDEMFKGTIKFYRFYSKALSDTEVAYNRMIDDARYFDKVYRVAIPVTNVVVAVSGIDGIADDHFAIDADGYTFTAPTSRTVEGKRYALGGYTLETWNGSAWVADGEGTHTGNAVAISDASALVRVTWQYSRPAGEGQLAHYDVGDYVTDGLMLFYDGIRNQGANAPHSYDATTWVNLGNGSGDSQDWTLAIKHKVTSGDIGYWADDGYEFKGFSDFQKMGNSFSIPVSHTIQTLIDASIDEQYWKTAQAYVYATAWDKSSLALRTKDDTPKVNSFYWVTQGGSYRTYILNGSGRYDYATAIQDGDAKTTAFFAGVTPPTTGGLADGFKQYDSELSSASVANIFLGGYNADSHMFTGKMKFFRYYPNKKLSPSELAQNRKVDEYRYFGRYVVTNVLVQSTCSYLQGNEADGPYEVVDSYTFTAPESVTVGEITYAPAGYAVQAWDNAAGCWGAATEYAGASYRYTTASGKVRLLWRWKGVNGIRTAADYDVSDYVAGGLVVNFDGIRNAGANEAHDPNATTWVNIGTDGEKRNATVSKTTDLAWTGNGYTFDGTRKFLVSNATGIGTASHTVQFLTDAVQNDQQNPSSATIYFFSGAQSVFAAATYGGSFYYRIQGNGNDANLRFTFDKAKPLGYVNAITDAAAKKAYVFQGDAKPTTSPGVKSYDSISTPAFGNLAIGGWGGGESQFMKGTINFFRYYDRVLSDAELAHNRNVDAARYFGELGVTNVVVAVEAGSGITATPAPGAYFVEGAHSFTASGAAGIGYRLSVPDGNGGWTTLKAFVEGGSYSYDKADADTPPCVKIEWRVQKPFIMILR